MSDFHHIVCAGCAAINRVPAARLAGGPKCGRCKQSLFSKRPFELNGADFERHVAKDSLPLVVDFWAPWCGPCRTMAPIFAEAAARLEPQARFAKLDTEAETAVAARFNIRSIPTLAVFRNGREIARTAGAMDLDRLTAWIRTYI